ncbi:MAG TPA: hypothetical protein VL947_06915 [Cytophagales bacterium]|nr:hypothetical protein [Cytophagales bacterium]
MRFHIFEFEDLPWLPTVVRDGMTDFLQFLLQLIDFYRPVSKYVKQLMEHTGALQVIDLCSGGGGYAAQLQKNLSLDMHRDVKVTLTDKYPNITKYEYYKQNTGGHLDYVSTPIDATEVPESLQGVRTMFSAAHHFTPKSLKGILSSAVAAKAGIAIFDGGNRNPFMIVALILVFPVLFLCCTPFIKPFKWSRIFLTYVLPVIPLLTMWDGAVSIWRLHSPDELATMAAEASHGLNTSYKWQAGKISNKLGMKISFLMGHP